MPRRLASLLCLLLLPLPASAGPNQGYYRFPALHGNTIVFTAEGDLWKVSTDGGLAQRLTTHLAPETHASISPDGKTVAFIAHYDGPSEVYVMPLEGGLPARLTYDGETARVSVAGWTPDGKVLCSTRHFATLPGNQLVRVDPQTRRQERLPLAQASDGVFDPSGKTLFFTRLAFQGSGTKRYKGGTAQNLWKFTLGNGEAVPLTSDYAGTSKAPMWWDHRVYFATDRDGTMNLWSMTEDGKELEQHTFHKSFDVQTPALSGGKIVYQLGADLHLFDIASGKDRLVPIELASDFDQTREKWVKKPMDYLTSAHLSPDGERVALTARGHLPLLERVRDRDELNNLIEQVVGEFEALHVFVSGGDRRKGPDQVEYASLGAELTRDEKAGGYRIEHIYQGDPDYPEGLAPLARADDEIEEGDIIETINGVATLSVPHPGMLLRNQAGRAVLLQVKARGTGKSRRVLVTPITNEKAASLRYAEWELTRRQAVEEQGSGKIGYVHLQAMGTANIADWARNFYPVFDRQGLIIDVRNNRGGNIDSWVLEKLLRKAWFYWQPRVGRPMWNMQYAFRGHIVVLCNEATASDGEAFTEGFRRLGLGKVIGTRTWGGEIWLTLDTHLADGGIASVPQMGVFGPERTWLIEGHGVEPDIVVDNLPHATFQGQDAQLERAIRHIREEIRKNPVPVPAPPPYPEKGMKENK